MKNIVLCGSMTFVDEMQECAEVLRGMGFVPIVPIEDDWNNICETEINAYKAKVSRRHFDRIADVATWGILVVNKRKNNVDNYIGANSFAEIALAFYFGKRIFLLHDMYEPYVDELSAWGVEALGGDVLEIIQK